MATENRTDIVIRQAATLVSGSILVLAASVLFIGAAVGNVEGAVAIIALLNAAIFYFIGMACVSGVLKPWREQAQRGFGEEPGRDGGSS
jgi:hypothetical protein